jgi:Restriction endonuclease XhoI
MTFSRALEGFRTRKSVASNRQLEIQEFCVAELTDRGVPDVGIELSMPGAYRIKKWDVGVVVDGEPRLAISCKSIIKNHGGTVPNRVDDLLGEAVSLHRAFPRAVLGYLFMMSRRDEGKASNNWLARQGGISPEVLELLHTKADSWFERLVDSVTRASGRAGPDDRPELFEVVSCAQIDFDVAPYAIRYPANALDVDAFFDELARLYFARFASA